MTRKWYNNDSMEVKTCSRCGIEKPLSEFNKRSNRPSGVTSRCKVCRKDEHYMRIYGINLKEYNAMLVAQNKKCKICGTETDLVVDHDHETGDVRGLLCAPCNSAIGLFKENRTSLLNAIEYVDYYGS